jgi:two-component system chemotaxis response regulator CheY
MRALIVDDSRFVRNVLRGLLEERGMECEEAGDGEAAMNLVHHSARFDVAFVDWNMPVMNGLEMLRQARADGYDDMKVIMVTTEGDRESILRALAAGADEYLMKPFDRDGLLEKLALLGIEEQG